MVEAQEKRSFRCTVCNDIHVGIKPPHICPTCGVERGYVEIDERESGFVQGYIEKDDKGTFSQEEVKDVLRDFIRDKDFILNPDSSMVDRLVEGTLTNEKNHGLKYCPCRIPFGDIREDLALICPCNFKTHPTWKEKGECWCGLFVKGGD